MQNFLFFFLFFSLNAFSSIIDTCESTIEITKITDHYIYYDIKKTNCSFPLKSQFSKNNLQISPVFLVKNQYQLKIESISVNTPKGSIQKKNYHFLPIQKD